MWDDPYQVTGNKILMGLWHWQDIFVAAADSIAVRIGAIRTNDRARERGSDRYCQAYFRPLSSTIVQEQKTLPTA